jgi:hypothetical protein
MASRYIAVEGQQPPEDVHSVPDYAPGGWQFAAYSDLTPGPVELVTVAVTEEPGKEQCDVVFGMNHHVGCGIRVRGAYHRIEWTDEDPEVPDMIPDTYDVDVISGLRISMYGAWGRRGLAAALREAAAMLDGADGHLPQVKGPGA